MALDLRFYSNDLEFLAAVGGTDEPKIVAEWRGGDGRSGGGERELILREGTSFSVPPGEQTSFVWANEVVHKFQVEWNPNIKKLFLRMSRPATPFGPALSEELEFDDPAGFGLDGWAAMAIRLRIPSYNEWTNPGRRYNAVVRMDNMSFEGEGFGSFILNMASLLLGPGDSNANIITLWDAPFNNGWIFEGDMYMEWGNEDVADNANPPPPGGLSQNFNNGPINGYPPRSFFDVTVKLLDPPPETLTPPPTGGPEGDAPGCFTQFNLVPPSCLVQDKEDCFRYQYSCVDNGDGPEWELDFAECVANNTCSEDVIQDCTDTTFLFEARNTCNQSDPLPTTADPRFTNLCFPNC